MVITDDKAANQSNGGIRDPPISQSPVSAASVPNGSVRDLPNSQLSVPAASSGESVADPPNGQAVLPTSAAASPGWNISTIQPDKSVETKQKQISTGPPSGFASTPAGGHAVQQYQLPAPLQNQHQSTSVANDPLGMDSSRILTRVSIPNLLETKRTMNLGKQHSIHVLIRLWELLNTNYFASMTAWRARP